MRSLFNFLLVFSLALGPVMSIGARTLDGVNIPETYKLDGKTLVLNGAGDRSKWFMDQYVASLYLPEETTDARAIINADEPQVLILHIVSDMITSERMKDATMEGFRNSTDGDLSAIPEEVYTFLDVFSDEINKGDTFELAYLPGNGVRASKNGKELATIGDLRFKKILFGIWLSDKPAQKDLKKELLGK
ncbi:chalcone isomerase family protein [Marinobacter sp.]|jgi:hypothetical protein|uniref:chalcone isomerase family protein n=1 Tax=Marinobacter sp. TaxID=50741 RepID=UPI0019885DDB|nr:chalcone isomerase family protein [Marinobacter sp.]MBC7192432.1 chalcone isomerase family protein [Marinobacter sp.]